MNRRGCQTVWPWHWVKPLYKDRHWSVPRHLVIHPDQTCSCRVVNKQTCFNTNHCVLSLWPPWQFWWKWQRGWGHCNCNHPWPDCNSPTGLRRHYYCKSLDHLKDCEKFKVAQAFFKQNLEDISPFSGATDIPVLEFWWYLLWVQSQGGHLTCMLSCLHATQILTHVHAEMSTPQALVGAQIHNLTYGSLVILTIQPLQLSSGFIKPQNCR